MISQKPSPRKPNFQEPSAWVFDRADIKTIVGIPVARVKDWSVGRPLRITPSVRISHRRGYPNLYGVEDVRRFALASQLSEDSIEPKMIQTVLDQPHSRTLTKYSLLRIAPAAREKVRFIETRGPEVALVLDVIAKEVASEFVEERLPSFYCLDLRQLIESVDERIEAYMAQRRSRR